LAYKTHIATHKHTVHCMLELYKLGELIGSDC